MGYIASSSTLSVIAYLTQKGRELLLTGTESDVTSTYFSLGDSDANYQVNYGLDSGFVPDITGDSTGSCITSIASNIGLISNVIYNGIVDSTKQVRVLRNDNSWVTNLRVLVHLDKLARYELYKNIRNTVVNNRSIDFNQLSPFADFYQHISVFESKNGTDIGQQDTEIKMNMQFDPKFFIRLSSTWVQASQTKSGPTLTTNLAEGYNITGQTLTQFVGSPLVFAFSSTDDHNGGVFGGAGKGGIIVYGREEGYYITKYNVADTNKTPITGFPVSKTPSQVEGVTFNLEETVSISTTNPISSPAQNASSLYGTNPLSTPAQSSSSLYSTNPISSPAQNASSLYSTSPTNVQSITYKTEITPAVRIRTFNNSGTVLSENIYIVSAPINTNIPNPNIGFFIGSNETITFNNQYSKLYKDSPNNSPNKGILYDEVTNLKEFIRSNSNKDIFQLLVGSTTEYRSVPLKFLIYSSDSSAKPAILEVILKYDNTVVLGSDPDYLSISSANDTNFIQYL